MHFLCGIFFDRNSLPRGSLSQNSPFSMQFFVHMYVLSSKIKCLLSCFQLNTSEMVETTKKFEISTLSYPRTIEPPGVLSLMELIELAIFLDSDMPTTCTTLSIKKLSL